MIESVCCVQGCGVVYGKKAEHEPGVQKSHGYCPKHAAEMWAAVDEYEQEKNTIGRMYGHLKNVQG